MPWWSFSSSSQPSPESQLLKQCQDELQAANKKIRDLEVQLSILSFQARELKQELHSQEVALLEQEQSLTTQRRTNVYLRQVSLAQEEKIRQLCQQLSDRDEQLGHLRRVHKEEDLPAQTFSYLNKRDSLHRTRVLSGPVDDWTSEKRLHQSLLLELPEALREYRFLWDYEWPERPSYGQRKGDFVFTNGLNRFVVVECKVLPWTPGSAKQRNRKRKTVKQQAKDIAIKMQAAHPDRKVLYAWFSNDSPDIGKAALSQMIELPPPLPQPQHVIIPHTRADDLIFNCRAVKE